MRRISKGVAKDEVTYFYLITRTERGRAQSEAQKKRGANDVTKVVLKAGGQCRLYSTRGSSFDYVSVITGVSAAATIRIVEEIEKLGAVKATLVSGVEMFGG
ncbi:hypothetical protein MTX26_13510 [Bradyrhizobium sp. ISRA443]|uniref:hypothetical protein n=1 Tax=unclassified Bradyrhizobium TaxID=2631580 RepID=UPI0024797989|nr:MULTISPECIES: hypothetical protein [unclassified Bradyrhizobium]WGR91494.1 hypothetical protein MTX20_23995 [Bradyrhizobium sp. ISRA435]WGS01771.1 hypothetical protein MTX23_13520 [Bradyrhizobium sp. ISRA436]WGS08657.1 hypothetical protein MTX18_13510 [Bradyrhizobium sp. ISRA437]WGS15545.1 hypothetical protein MTX26_13510 [Bradyrhizobium sp. ISRA443]